MTTFILTFVVFALLIAAMAIGVLMGRKPISGSCGGIAALGLDTECEICGGDPSKCDTEMEAQNVARAKSSTEFYDAS